jgi:hypothetical protein
METRMPLIRTRARSLAGVALASASAVAIAFASRDASASTKQECIKASERGQQSRDEGKLTEARRQFLFCVQDACPRPVAESCREDLATVERRLPTVVLGAKSGSGSDLVDVAVQIDGALIARKLDGLAMPLDPGPHRIRMEAAGQVVEEQVVVIEGEKNRPVRLSFPAPPGAGAPPVLPPASAADGGEAPPSEDSSGVHPAVWIFGGLAVASVGAFAFFALKGKSEIDDLRATCAPRCVEDDVDAAKSKLLIGDVFLAVGVVSAGAATYFALAPRKSAPVSVGARGLGLELRARFE